MIPKITSEDTHQAWAERQEENARQLRENEFFCLELDRREKRPLTTYPEDLPF